jgi:hypothetical protein
MEDDDRLTLADVAIIEGGSSERDIPFTQSR